MNVTNGAVRALAGVPDFRVRAEAVTGLYVIGRLSTGEKLDDRHNALLDTSLQTLIAAASGERRD